MHFRNMLIPAVVGLGLYTQANNINLSTNTATLLEMLLLLTQQEEVVALERQVSRLNCTVYGTPFSIPYREEFIAPITTQAAVSPFATNYGCCV